MLANAKKRKPNPLRMDPTRTASLRRRILAQLRTKFKKLRSEIRKLVIDEDAFGLKEKDRSTAAVFRNQRFAFQTDPQKVKGFRDWLRSRFASGFTRTDDEELWRRYIEEGFRKGAGRSFDDVRQSELRRRRPELFTPERQGSVRDFYEGSREEFLRSSFARPVAVEKVRLIAGRAFDDLEDVTRTMGTRMTRVLTDGLVEGKSPRDIARDLDDQLDIGRSRAETIARTEIIRAHAEGQLQAMEDLGVEQVGVAVEWTVTDDELVCPMCEPLEGVVLTLDEARGMLPRHPNCRCAWIPANVGEDEEGQKDTQKQIERAVEESEEAGGDNLGLDVDSDRPRSVLS